MTGISIKEDKELADSIEEVYQQRGMADTILEEIYQIYYGGKMFAKTKLPEIIKQDREKAKKWDVYQQCIKESGGELISAETLEYYKKQDKIVSRLDESIEALEKEKEYHEKHNPNAPINHQITWIALGKKIREGKNA